MPDQQIWQEVNALSAIWENLPGGSIRFQESNNLPFGGKWNPEITMQQEKVVQNGPANSPVRDIGNTIRKCQRSRSDRAELSRVGAQFGRGIIYLFREIVKMKRYDLESGDVVPGWMEIEYCVAALRTQYLEEKLFAT